MATHAERKRLITPEEELQALALWTLAKQRYQEVQRFEEQMNALLGIDDSGPLSAAIYSNVPLTKQAFAAALAEEGLDVEPDTSMT